MGNLIFLAENPMKLLKPGDGSYKVTDPVILGLSMEVFEVLQVVTIGLIGVSLAVDTVRYGLKKEYTAMERKGWFWPDLIFKLLLVVIVVNFPYLYGLCFSIVRGIMTF